MPEDPYSDRVTGVLYNKLGLGTAAELEAAEREITHAALILLDESPVSPSYDLPHLQAIHMVGYGIKTVIPGAIRRFVATPRRSAGRSPSTPARAARTS